MSLSAHVDALLEVYSKCLGLLHMSGDASKHREAQKRTKTARGAAASDGDRQSRLARSLHADRAKVVNVFASHLSQSGTLIAKGDPRSRSALRRIASRLSNVLSGIFRLRTTRGGHHADGQPLLNYDALRALSKSSRVGAIHAMDDLSVRLRHASASRAGSRGGHSLVDAKSAQSGSAIKSARLSKAIPSSAVAASKVASRSPAAAPSAGHRLQTAKMKEQPRQLPAAGASSSSAPKAPSSSHGDSKSKSKSRSKKSKSSSRPSDSSAAVSQSKRQDAATNTDKPREKEPGKKKKSSPVSSRSSSHAAGPVPRSAQAEAQSSGRGSIDSGVSTTSTPKAGPLHVDRARPKSLPKHSARSVSMLSSSSASTRLGEIPQHKLRRQNVVPEPQDGSAQESFAHYNISVAYPMRPLWVPDDDEAGSKGKKKEKRHFWGRGRA